MVRTRSGRSTMTRSGPSDPIPITNAQPAIAEEPKSESDNDSVATSVMTSTEVSSRPRQSVGHSSRRKQNPLKRKEDEENDSDEATQVIDEEEENARRKKCRIQQNLCKAIRIVKECIRTLDGLT